MAELRPFTQWFENALRAVEIEDETERATLIAISIPPRLKASTHKACKAYGHHWRANPSLNCLSDCDSGGFNTFDSGMSCTVTQKRITRAGAAVDEPIQYVGVLTDILTLDYGILSKPVVLFRGRWADPTWTPKASASMRYDESGLWQVNFQKELGASKGMDYILPAQVDQVFFHPNTKGTGWRTILHKESRSSRVHGDYMELEFHDALDQSAKLHIDLAQSCRTDGRTDTRENQNTAPKRKRRVVVGSSGRTRK